MVCDFDGEVPMRSWWLVLPVVILCACDSPTEPVLPPGGTYTLNAVAEFAYPTLADAQWQSLPFEYDVVGDGTCVFRITGGRLRVANGGYSVDLQQSVVDCRYGWDAPTHESGTLQEVRVAGDGSLADSFAFLPAGSSTWITSGTYAGGAVIASLASPAGGRVTYLRFKR